MRSVLAGDLGGTKCRFALVTADRTVLPAKRVATTRDRARFLADLDAAIAAVLAGVPAGVAPPTAMGIGTAGVIPSGGRSIAYAPNLPLDGYPLADHVERRCALRTTLINDGRASAWGEYLVGSAQGLDPQLCLFFGTGIGIGLILGGRPYEGADNAAGEIGHTIHVPDGRPCACGRRGHFEAYCGGRAITERALAEVGRPPAGPSEGKGGAGEWTVGAVARSDHAAARAILADAALAAGVLTANACTLWNPRAVVLGGGVLDGWPALAPSIEAFVRAHCTAPITQRLEFHRSQGGSDAVLLGAAAAAGLFAPAAH